jgi:hypothetical protein
VSPIDQRFRVRPKCSKAELLGARAGVGHRHLEVLADRLDAGSTINDWSGFVVAAWRSSHAPELQRGVVDHGETEVVGEPTEL